MCAFFFYSLLLFYSAGMPRYVFQYGRKWKGMKERRHCSTARSSWLTHFIFWCSNHVGQVRRPRKNNWNWSRRDRFSLFENWTYRPCFVLFVFFLAIHWKQQQYPLNSTLIAWKPQSDLNRLARLAAKSMNILINSKSSFLLTPAPISVETHPET